MKKHTQETVIDDPAQPTVETCEAVLGPLRQAFEFVKTEVEAFSQASEEHAARLASLKTQIADQELKLIGLEGCKDDEKVVDVAELANAIFSTREGISYLNERLEKVEAAAPVDDVMQAAWQNCEAHFGELRVRIIRYHERVAQHALDQIAWIHADMVTVPNYCRMCGNQHGGSQTVRSNISIHFLSEALSRVNALTISTPDGLNHVAIAERCIADLRVALEEIDDLSKLGPYIEPTAEGAPIEPTAVAPKWPRPTVARPQPQPTALHPMSTSALGGMADRLAEAEARNEAQRQEWRKAGLIPAESNSLKVGP